MALNVYNQTYNYDNSVIRYIILALLSELKNKIYIYDHTEDGAAKRIIPFYMSTTGSERFLTDEFKIDAEANGKAIGNYDRVPRGVLDLNSVSVDASSQTNKFVRTRIVHEVEGSLKTFYMRCCYLPLNMTFTCTIECNNFLEELKIMESLHSKLYSVNMFYVDLGLMPVQASYTMPPDYNAEKTVSFQLADVKEYKLTFSIEVKSFMPVFEHGILFDEVAELIKGDAVNGSIIQLRVDKYGNVGLYPNGLMLNFDSNIKEEMELENPVNIHFDNPPKTDIQSNQNPDIPQKDYTVKTPGIRERQNLRR